MAECTCLHHTADLVQRDPWCVVHGEKAAFVRDLQWRVEALEARITALEGENSPESAPTRVMR